jgi:Zn finger protein HypA/HybF involved in hydrogenase expression
MKHAQASQFPQQFSPALQAIHHGELVIGNKLNLREKETHLACPNTKKKKKKHEDHICKQTCTLPRDLKNHTGPLQMIISRNKFIHSNLADKR